MKLTWKIILPLVIIVVGGAAAMAYKNQPAKQSSESDQNTTTEQKTYDPNAKPITDAEINLLIKEAGAESSAETEEAADTTLVNSEKQELNNFDNVYVPTDF